MARKKKKKTKYYNIIGQEKESFIFLSSYLLNYKNKKIKILKYFSLILVCPFVCMSLSDVQLHNNVSCSLSKYNLIKEHFSRYRKSLHYVKYKSYGFCIDLQGEIQIQELHDTDAETFWRNVKNNITVNYIKSKVSTFLSLKYEGVLKRCQSQPLPKFEKISKHQELQNTDAHTFSEI